jgi:hypothetical protein
MTHTKNLKSTFVLLKKLSPMLKIDEIDKYEKQNGMGQFDVFCKHKEGKKTMWGDEEIQFSSSTLRELANNLYDYLYDNYEVWIRETPEIVDATTEMSDDSLRYAIALQADNVDEDHAILGCRIVSGWLVISAIYDATIKQKSKFYTALGMNHHLKTDR